MSLKLFVFTFQAMGCGGELQIYSEEEKIAKAISDSVIEDIKAVETKFSRYKPESIISKINAAAGEKALEVDEETAHLLNYANTCFQESDELFDLTSGALRRAWDFRSGKLPTQSSIDELLPLIGWQKVEWQNPFFRLPLKGMEIDFGGIGKEYAVDRSAGLLQKSGIESALINLGGDIRVLGPQPGDKEWSIGISHPRKNAAAISSLKLKQGALATSGDYERFMDVEGKRYCHLLNPKTGWPVDAFQSVTVISESCLVAGTASTIAMLKGEKAGISFLDELKLSYFVVNKNGTTDNSPVIF